MDYGVLLSGAFFFLLGSWWLWYFIRSIRFHLYLQDYGILTSSVITEARLGIGSEGYISRFKVTYQDQHQCLHQAAFSAQDSDEDYLYLVGGEVLIYYDPLWPKRSATAEAVNSVNRYSYAAVILLGGGNLTVGLHLLWEALSKLL